MNDRQKQREGRLFRAVLRSTKEPVTDNTGSFIEGANAFFVMERLCSLLHAPKHAVKRSYMVVLVDV